MAILPWGAQRPAHLERIFNAGTNGKLKDNPNFVAQRVALAFAAEGVRADALEIANLTTQVAEFYLQDQGEADAFTLFGQRTGVPGEYQFFEYRIGYSGSAAIGNQPGLIRLETEGLGCRSVFISNEIEVNAQDEATAGAAGLALYQESMGALVHATRMEANSLFWHGDAANEVNGITGSTVTVNGRTFAGRAHPKLPTLVCDLDSLTADFTETYRVIVDGINYSQTFYSTNVKPDSVVMSPILWSKMTSIRANDGSGQTLLAALREAFPEIRNWNRTQALNATGPNGATSGLPLHGLLAYSSGDSGLRRHVSMLPTMLPTYRLRTSQFLPMFMQVGGISIGRNPSHVLLWLPGT